MTKQAYKDSTLNESLTVNEIMDSWTLKKGYPVVDMKRDYDSNKAHLTQKWFLLNPLNKVSEQEYKQYTWYVPVTYTTKKEPQFEFESKTHWLKPYDSECNSYFFNLNIDSGF
jgi:aminopeptidase N